MKAASSRAPVAEAAVQKAQASRKLVSAMLERTERFSVSPYRICIMYRPALNRMMAGRTT